MSVLISIDPGATGGIAIQKGGEVWIYKMPSTLREICDLLEQAQRDSGGESFDGSPGPALRCYMERVGGYIGGAEPGEDGVRGGQPGSAMFTFGCGYGALQGMLTALRVPYELVSPQTWIKGLGLGTKGLVRPQYTLGMSKEDKSREWKRVAVINGKLKRAWKGKLKQTAEQLYPHLKATLATSDCLLILEYARRRERIEQARPRQGALL